MFNCGIPTPTRSSLKKKNNDNINEGTIKYCNPIKSVWKIDETFVLIFGTLSLLNSRFYGMRNPFHSLSSEIVKNGPFALRGHVTSFLWKWKLYDFAFEKRLVGHILNKIIVIWFFKPAPFSQNESVRSWSRDQNVIFKITNYLFLNTHLALKHENVEKMW